MTDDCRCACTFCRESNHEECRKRSFDWCGEDKIMDERMAAVQRRAHRRSTRSNGAVAAAVLAQSGRRVDDRP